MFKNLFRANKRQDLRLKFDGLQVIINNQKLSLSNLSHLGFALDNAPSSIQRDVEYHITLIHTLPNKKTEISCRSKLIWHHLTSAGFAFHEPTPEETLNIDYLIKTHKIHQRD